MSNLLKDASILLTPTAYDNGRMNATKPSKDLYGPELVTNGDFATDSDWTLSSGSSIENGKLTIDALDGSYQYARQIFSTTIGSIYKLEFDITEINNVGKVQLLYDSVVIGEAEYTSIGTRTLYFESTNSSGTLEIKRRHPSNTNVSIDNVSVVEDLSGDFQFERNSAATRVNAQGLVENVQIISSELVSNGNFSQIGTEEVLNGNFSQEGSEVSSDVGFDNPSNWTLTGQSTVSNGKAHIIQDNTSNTGVIANTTITNKTYKITGVVSDYVSGSVGFASIGSTTPRELIPAQNGEFTIYYTSTRSTPSEWNIQRIASPCNLKIDNVSVKEVGQNWDTFGTIDTNNTVSFANNELTLRNDGSGSGIKQSVLTSGKTYKVVVNVTDIIGNGFKVDMGNLQNITTTGIKTFYLKATSPSLLLYRNSTSPQAVNGATITNISVKEVGQDWTFHTGWSVDQANSKVIGDGTMSGSDVVRQIIYFTQGNSYRFSFTVEDYVSGSLFIRQPFNGYLDAVSANGSYSFDYVAGINDYIDLRGNSFVGSFTNVSVKEITDDTNIPRINYEGFSYQDSLGSEEVVNGDFSVDSNWNKGGGWSISGGTANTDGTPSSEIRQNNVTIVGKQYKYSFTISNSGSGVFSARLRNKSTGTPILNFSSEGTYSGTFTSNGTFIDFVTLSNNTASFSIDNVSVKEYLGQEVVPDSGCGSWLLEPQSTNLATKSENISGWSFPTNVTTTQNYGTSPDGSVNSTRLQFTANGFMNDALTLTSGTEYTLSIYAKRNDTGTQSFGFYVNGIPTVVGGITLTDEWQRFTYTYTASSNSSIGLAGDSGADVSVFGFQAEAKSYATSYIPTNGATNTRLQDIATNSGNSSLINSTEGVLYAEMAALADDGISRQISLNDNSYTNTLLLRYLDLSNKLQGVFRVGGAFKGSCNFTLSNSVNFIKVAYKYKDADFALWVNGVEVATSTDNFSISAETLTELSFDRGDGGQKFEGKNKALAVYKEALTDANLRCLTYPNPVATTFDLDFDTIAEQFTFTRGSEATFVNEQGLIESTNQIGPELVTNGDFATDSDWNKGTGWSINGGKADSDGSGNYQSISQSSLVSPVGKTYKVTYEVSDYVSGEVRCILGGFTLGQITSSNGVVTEYLTASNASSNTFVYIETRGSGFIGSIDNVSVKEVISATNTPRIDYSTGAEAFLLEPQSTNLITYSSDFSQSSWSSFNGTIVVPNQITSPDGSSLADRIECGINGNQTPIFDYINITNGEYYTFSVFAKKGEIDKFIISGQENLLTNVSFNLTTGTIISTSGSGYVDSTIEEFSNGWYRCSVTALANGTRLGRFILYAGISGNEPNLGDGIYYFGAQQEQRSYATSYIPTSGAAATRNQELCADATPVINSEEGTLYAEVSNVSKEYYGNIALTDGTNSQRVQIYFNKDALSLMFFVRVDGVLLATHTVSSSGINYEDTNKIAIKYKTNDISFWLNGTKVGTDTTGTFIPNKFTQLGFNSGNGGVFFGSTKDLKVYPKALADVQLEDLTTI